VNRRNFFRASASPVLAPLLAPVFSPLRMYAQESRKSDQLTITKVEPYIVRLPPAGGGGRAGGPGGRAGGPAGGRGGGGGEGAGGYPCVRIETAEGIHGWGEGTTPPTTPAILTQIRESGKVIMGKSAWDVEGHWVQMYTTEFNTLGATLFAAMSAIDMALWDIVGKKLGVPVYKLLGGRAIPANKGIRLYASEPWRGLPQTREAYRERTKEIISKGATGGKTDFFGGTPLDRQLPTKNLNLAREMIAGIREASPAFDICVEAHALRCVLRRRTGSAGRRRGDGVPPALDERADCNRREFVLAVRVPRDSRKEWRPNSSTRPGQDRRHQRCKKDRRNG
jgi:hypothetical protein